MLSLLRQSATSAAKHNGYYWHVQINMNGVINEVKLMPFKDCRFAKPDDTGYAAKILYYDNWNKEICYKKFDKDKILDYFIFNLNKDVIAAQFKEVGNKHKGQVYFQFLDNDYFYPLSPFDAAYLDLDTEYQIQLFKNRQIRDGFFDTILMRIAATGTDEEKEEFANEIKKQLGPDGNKVIIFEDDVDENGQISDTGAFKVDRINTTVNDKLFENWEKGLANNIRKTIKGIPAILIDYEENRLGNTSGEAIIQATNFYNALTKDDRSLISNSFKEIFSNHVNPVLSGNTNWNIKPLSLIEEVAEVQKDEAEIERIKAQSMLKGSVGGVTALIQLQQAVSSGSTDLEAAVTIVKEIYGIEDSIARKMVGNPNLNTQQNGNS